MWCKNFELKKCLGRSDSEVSEGRSAERKVTDVVFLIFMAAFLLILLFCMMYCIIYGDIYRIVNGYDRCGNVCGKKNVLKHISNDSSNSKGSDTCASGLVDNSLKPYLLVAKDGNTKLRSCVPNCNEEQLTRVLNRCYEKENEHAIYTFFSRSGLSEFFEEVEQDFQMCWREIILLCLISLGLSLLTLFFFRYFVGFIVWFVLFSVVLICVFGTIYLWVLWSHSRGENDHYADDTLPILSIRKTTTFLAFAIAASVVTLIVGLVIFVLRKRIDLVVLLFQESGKALAAMPILLLQPLWVSLKTVCIKYKYTWYFQTFISLAGVVFLWFYFSLWIESSGFLEPKRSMFHYEKDVIIKTTRWYNIFAALWTTQYIIGCQHMVIAGAVSIWYFARDKKSLNGPIKTSLWNLLRYHLGSVALGSFIIAIVQFIRILLKFAENLQKKYPGKISDVIGRCCCCCFYCFEKFLKYLSRNAYIEVAAHGYSFCRGGTRAFKLLVANALRVATINSVGDFILFLGKVTVVMLTILIGIHLLKIKEGVQHLWVPVTLAALFAYFVAHCFLTVFEMTIDTIFLCFCEDCEQNDGQSKPYYMSKSLMELVDKSK